MSLGLNDPAPVGAFTPAPRHKSAGLAFLFSALIPGSGQLYCGKTGRGGLTLAFWVFGVVLCFIGAPTAVLGVGVSFAFVLWVFSFLDAYFTAIEINKGIDEQVDVQNPRVAVTLNLLTAGFGYFYLGERGKGIALFIGMQVSRLVLPGMMGFAGGVISLLLVVVQLAMAVDAYRIATRQMKEALGPEPAAVPGAAPDSRLPAEVPMALAGMVTLVFVLLVVVGLAMRAGQRGKYRAGRVPTKPRIFTQSPGRVNSFADPNPTPVPAVDLPTAVQNIQKVQRQVHRLRSDDIPNLQQDVRVLASALSGNKIDPADAVVGHYFRGVALALINMAHYHDGREMDLGGARVALADLDKVVGGGPATARTYVPAVSISNAQYWAGIVARNQLRDEKRAYAYWEQCAGQGHGGCIHDVAYGHVTGEGGEKADLHRAIELHASVFDTGVKYHCAGALSAMQIAYINYFTDTRRPGDDELQWAQKADVLFDRVQAAENNRSVCGRADSEVDEFLLQLSHGHRDDNILQDALSRLDDDSRSTRAVIQFISGAIDAAALDSAVEAEPAPGERCSAYFDAMWYAALRKDDAVARRYHQHLADIGKFHCGEHLVYAAKFNF